MAARQTLDEYLDQLRNSSTANDGVEEVIAIVAAAAIDLSGLIANSDYTAHTDVVGQNSDGDQQKVLDVVAHQLFLDALKSSPIGTLASEEAKQPIELNNGGALAMAIDPLDGSSNIETNAPVGTIFSILPRDQANPEASFYCRGDDVLAAGFVAYGPRTQLYLTLGSGTQLFFLDHQTGEFVLGQKNIQISSDTAEFAINMSNYRHWFAPTRQYVNDCLEGESGVRGKNFNMRWIASLVAEASRIFARGGVFLYPGDGRDAYHEGRLRLLYEAVPLAKLVEQAGGSATTGQARILDIVPHDIHQRTPFVFGSNNEVAIVERLHNSPVDGEAQTSPLFGHRGLFRA